MRYIIHKSSRALVKRTYSGPTWDVAGLRVYYREYYTDRKLATSLAYILSCSNPVGFTVSVVNKTSCS